MIVSENEETTSDRKCNFWKFHKILNGIRNDIYLDFLSDSDIQKLQSPDLSHFLKMTENTHQYRIVISKVSNNLEPLLCRSKHSCLDTTAVLK